jgi:hypothetical protein
MFRDLCHDSPMRASLVAAAVLATAASAVSPAHGIEELSRFALEIQGTVTMPCDGCGWRSDGTFSGVAATAVRVEPVSGTFVYDELAPCLTGAGHLTFVFAGATRHVHWARTGAVLSGYGDGMAGAGAFLRDSSPCGGPAGGTFTFTLGYSPFDPGPPPG